MVVPTATYRLQFGPSFGFKDAEALVPYLHALGISDIYASPIFKAGKGSTHGYDVTNPNELNPQLGSTEDFSALTARKSKYGMGWLQDVVPNHMAYSNDNPMLMDIFKNGRDSRYADFFDVDWDHPDESLRGKILAPFLGKPCSEALRDGEIQLERSASGWAIRYYDISFPLALSSYSHDESGTDMPSLDSLLERQFFKLCFWKRANESINYRRFFYLNNFIALKAEKPEVFSATHGLISELIRQGAFTGLRVDHIDGLYDPARYLARLHRLTGDKYIIVEKILDLDEFVPEEWPVQGTTGYDFCNHVNGIFVRQENEQAFTDTYRAFAKPVEQYTELLIEKKRAICEKYMGGDIEHLVRLFWIAVREQPHLPGELPPDVRQAIVEVVTAFDVYRTYVTAERYSTEDKARATHAIDEAKRTSPALKDAIDLVGRVLLLDLPDAEASSVKARILDFIMKLQQLTGPVMAKGFEDTLLYNYNRLVSLNEVGGRPDRFGISLDEFHEFNAAKAAHWPHGLNATSTHDTKRGEDVRARIAVLSEMPELWSAKVHHWRQINLSLKSDCHGSEAPDPNDEYLLYQTLIGAMPFDPGQIQGFRERIKQYMIKVVREAKEHSSWIERDEQYEQACEEFVERILSPSISPEFWSDFLPFQKRIATYGIFNSLSQTLLKMTSPGVPDFYQGSELWDLNLVDPDNRRLVDFEKRKKILDEIRERAYVASSPKAGSGFLNELLQTREDGRIKLFLIYRVLNMRRQRAELFEKGEYEPLKAEGQYGKHVVVFLRRWRDQSAIVITPRFLTSLIGDGELPLGTNVWQDTEISWPAHGRHPPGSNRDSPALDTGRWQNVISGESTEIRGSVPVGRLLARFPVSLLVK